MSPMLLYSTYSVTRKKSPNVYISCTKLVSLQKLNLLTPLQKLPKNEDHFGKIVVAKGLKQLLKVQQIAKSGRTVYLLPLTQEISLTFIAIRR